MNHRIDTSTLMNRLAAWDSFLKRRVRLIACGGTALTLLNIKPSTKDADFIIPDEREHNYLVNILGELGYVQVTGTGWARENDIIFDFYRGLYVYTTGLLDSPLEQDRHILFKEYTQIYVGILNYYDLLITKLFRGIQSDMEDSVALLRAKENEINMTIFEKRFRETAKYDISEKRVLKNLDYFISIIRKEGLNGKR
jgi:hypothetical protein